MAGNEVAFLFQFGSLRDVQQVSANTLTLKSLKDLACDFINAKIPDNGLNHLADRLLLFRHDYSSNNVLQIINAASEIVDETLVEIVLTGNAVVYNAIDNEIPVIRPHALGVHSYTKPTFCDFCGEMLFGLVRQGLKCEGCAQNYHKRCVVKVPNNCSRVDQNKPRNAHIHTPRSASSGSNHSIHSQDDQQSLLNSGSSLHVPNMRHNRSPSTGSQAGQTAAYNQSNGSQRYRIPHTFVVHSYTRPTVCQHCKKLLRGLFKQGVQCRDCHYNAHKKCLENVPKDCESSLNFNDLNDVASGGSGERDSLYKEENDDSDQDEVPAMQDEGLSQMKYNGVSNEDLLSEQMSRQSESSSSPSANIPLMRIVQSVKHTKKRDGRAVKEGWLVHFTNKDKTVKRHYWRLDSKAITLFVSDQGSKYSREIPLNEILTIDTARNLQSDVLHCFEIRTANVDYFVGQDPLYNLKEGEPMLSLPPPDSGVGAYLAKSWETAVRQALMPVSNASNASNSNTELNLEPEETITDMGQLYQIFPDEVLGSGQFGIVYGGIHRKTHRQVAIKVIDKLRFPTKQEAQLKNEVAILQNLQNPGVVNLERMFETPERIFVVMEKLKGDMLEMILSHKNGRLSERVTKFLITQILIALKHLHSRNIVHCDLKPENVLLSSELNVSEYPQLKLCDFGFSRIIGEKSFRRSVVGTPAYLAPEVLRNKGYNRSLDMWSVGVIIYVSLSGTFPFNEDEDINDQIQNAAFMYPPNPWKEISSDAIDLINNLLQVKQRKRFTVDKSLLHCWLQDPNTWHDLRALEAQIGVRYLTHESDDARWEAHPPTA